MTSTIKEPWTNYTHCQKCDRISHEDCGEPCPVCGSKTRYTAVARRCLVFKSCYTRIRKKPAKIYYILKASKRKVEVNDHKIH